MTPSLPSKQRRSLLVAVGASPALAWAGPLLAQSKKPPVVIGWLSPGAAKTGAYNLAAFREGMTVLGWREGTQFVLEERWAEGRMDRIQTLAEELVAKKPAVFIALATAVVRFLVKVAPGIPIVQATGGDLVATGFAASLARPGGMITGLTNINDEIIGKHVELLMETVPKTRHVGLLVDPGAGRGVTLEAAQRALARYSIKPLIANVRRPEEIEPAIARLAKDGAQALILGAAAWLTAERDHILRLALAQRWPVVGPQVLYAEVGALISYGTNRAVLFRRAAFYVDRILKGTKPGDLPIEQPTTFELVVNMKTAKALGITIPQTILVRADKVIQ
jgi:putative ABC transport system substrate-binding protein